MERRRQQDDGPWNRPHYGSAHSNQPADYYHEASPQYRRTGPYTDISHVPWDGRSHHQNPSQQPYAQLGSQTYGGSERRLPGSMEFDTFHHGHSHSLTDHEAQPGMFPRGSARVDGPQSGIPHMTSNEQRISQSIPPHMASIEQKVFNHGGSHSGVPPHITSTEQRVSQHDGLRSDVPPNRTSTDQRASQHGNPQSAIPHLMAGIEQRISQHGGPQSDISPHMTSTEHGGPHSSIPPHMASTEHRIPQHDGLRFDIPPRMANIEQIISRHGGPPSGVPPNRSSTDQRASQHGNPQSDVPHRMVDIEQIISPHGGPQSDISSHMTSTEHGGTHSSIPSHMVGTERRVSQPRDPHSGVPHRMARIEQRISQHGGPHSDFPFHMTSTEQTVFQHDVTQSDNPSHVARTEQRTFHHGGPQSGISPHMASNEQRTFQHGDPQSGVFKHGPSQPRSIHFGGPQLEEQHSNELQLKGPSQEMFRMEDSQKKAWSFQNAPGSGEPGISSFGDSQPELFNPASLNRPPPNDVFHHRVPPPSIIQQSSTQLLPGPRQNIQHPNNPIQSHYSFPPPLHGPPLNPPTIPSFVCPPQMGAVFSGPPSEGIPEVSHIQIQDRSENTAFFNPHRQDNHLHQDIRLGHKPDPFITSEVPGVQKNPFFSKNSFQVGDAGFFHQDLPDMLQDHHFKHQPILNEQHEKSLMNPNRQSEMLVGKEPADKDMFQWWLYNFLARRRNKVPPKPNPIQSLSIPEARNLIYGAMTLVSQLRSLCQCLENSKEEGPAWAEDYEKAKDLKVDLAKQIKELEKPGFIQCVKMKLDRVRKKRLRWQRRRQAKEEEEKEDADRVAEREAEIDTWRMRCVQEVEEKKKERELKAAADSVLGEVRKKQADTKKMLDMLKSLEKLRKLRKEAAARKGVSPPPSADETFKNHISRLRSMVHKRIALYDAEERALRVILEGEQEEERQRDKDKRLRKQRERFFQKQRELDSILFGDDEPLPALHPLQPFRQYYLQAEQSVVSLVQIRHEWDRFLAPPDHPDASNIPRGWVLPMPPSSEIWAATLTQAE